MLISRILSSAFFVLAILVFGLQPGWGGQKPPTHIVVVNRSGQTLAYRFRAIYNDGKGSDSRFYNVIQKDGTTEKLTAAGVPNYGIVLRLPNFGAFSEYKLYAQRGPYHIQSTQDILNPNRIVFTIHDGAGKRVNGM